jgi:hypothetical protein
VTTWLWDHIINSIKKASSNYSKTHTYTISNPQSSSTYKNPKKQTKVSNQSSNDEGAISDLLIDSPTENKSSRNKPSIRVGGSERWSHSAKKYITTRTGKKLYYQFTDITKEDINFDIEEDFSTTDSNVSTSTISSYVIYPAGETWVGVDQSTSEIDQDIYDVFIEFLKEYFTDDLKAFWERYDSVIK